MDSTAKASVRDQILAAAIDQIRENDGQELNSRQVARSANITPAMINYHFKNRDGLAQACVESYYSEIRKILTDLAPLMATETFEALTEKAVRRSLRYARNNRALARMVLLDFVRLGQMRGQPRSTEDPLVNLAVEALATKLGLPELEVRYRIKSIALLCGRYVVISDEELTRISGREDAQAAWSGLEEHLVSLAKSLVSS